MTKKLMLFLVFEVLFGINAGLTFRLVESRYVAALWTGSCFLALGGYLVYWTIKSLNFQTSLLFWVALIHTFIFSLPILLTRVLTFSNEPLSHILGFEASSMHGWASKVYALLILATVFELALIQFKKIKKP